MVNRLIPPWFAFVDATGAPRENCRLFFYASGTSTKLNIYSDEALSSANSNPMTINSAGKPANVTSEVAVFGQDLAYKVVLATAGSDDPPSDVISTWDPVSTSDFTARAKFTSYNGNPNTHVAGTAGTGSTPADAIWDYTNGVLYFCTTTGVAAAAVWTAYNPNTATSIVPPPQGRLTLISGSPYIASDQASATAVYYTPDVGVLVPIYNGSIFVPTVFAELMLTLVSAHAANQLYDVFIFSDSGVVTVGTGPAWTTATAGSGARGSGAGTTELTRLNGLWVNANQVTARNGSATYTVAANKATYVGTIIIDGSNGQISATFTFGQSRIYGVWNAYNRRPVSIVVGDSTSTWQYTTTKSVQPSRNTAANKATILLGLQEEMVDTTFTQMMSLNAAGSGSMQADIGIGFNSTSGMSGVIGETRNDATPSSFRQTPTAIYDVAPGIGAHVITALEGIPNAGASTPVITYHGTSSNMGMIIRYRG